MSSPDSLCISKIRKFKSKLLPNKESILIDKLFYHHWRNELKEGEIYYAVDPKSRNWKWKIVKSLGYDDVVVFPYGFEVRSAYGLMKKHTMEFYYMGNQIFYFKIFDINGSEIDYKNANMENFALIDLVSNFKHADENLRLNDKDDNVVVKSWTITLTAEAVSGRHPLLIPERIGHLIEEDDEKYIALVDNSDDDNNEWYDCKLMRSKGMEAEVYLDWNRFCTMKHMHKGDELKFTFHTIFPGNLFVDIFRH